MFSHSINVVVRCPVQSSEVVAEEKSATGCTPCMEDLVVMDRRGPMST